jgi:hypothetical protein
MVAATFNRMRYLTNLGATVLVIHHTGKDEKSDYRGASAMEGAVDAALKLVGTIEDGRLTRIEVQTFKTRLGDGKPVVYGMGTGVPVRQTATLADSLLDLLTKNPGLSKSKFEDLAQKAGFRRGTVREFIDGEIVGGKIKYEKQKLFPVSKGAPQASVFGSVQ